MMTNNDIFKKLRVALMLRDDQIVEILELVDFRITKSELGAFSEMKNMKLYGMWRPSVAFLKCFSHSFTRNKENQKAPLTS
jgi:uncharacterized protein YehS (DUF1456 family)